MHISPQYREHLRGEDAVIYLQANKTPHQYKTRKNPKEIIGKGVKSTHNYCIQKSIANI
jgi:hypothetical protein